MNLDSLLLLVPLSVGVVWLFYLIFRANLATQPLGKIISYFLGVLIIAIAVGWLIDFVFPNWVNTRLQRTTTSSEWQEVIDSSSTIIDSSFSAEQTTSLPTIPAPTIAPVISVTQSPTEGGVAADPNTASRNSNGQILHTVVTGDTLFGLADQYGVSVDAIRAANPTLFGDYIYVGDQIVIP